MFSQFILFLFFCTKDTWCSSQVWEWCYSGWSIAPRSFDPHLCVCMLLWGGFGIVWDVRPVRTPISKGSQLKRDPNLQQHAQRETSFGFAVAAVMCSVTEGEDTLWSTLSKWHMQVNRRLLIYFSICFAVALILRENDRQMKRYLLFWSQD